MNKKTVTALKRVLKLCGHAGALALVAAGFARAENISKTFEFGSGTLQPRSHVRTFPIPCGTAGGVATVVKFQRLGPDVAASDVPITIEFREPDTAEGVEGPIVEAKNATAKRAEQTVILRSQSSNRGCSLPWRVRVKSADGASPPVQAFGTARLDFDGRATVIAVDNAFPTIRKGETVTINLATSAGFEQGLIDIRARWRHSVFGLDLGPNNLIKLKWQLIDPSGTVVKLVEAYSNQDGSPTPRFVLTYQVTRHTPGNWKIKVTNTNANDDAGIVRYSVRSFTPRCP